MGYAIPCPYPLCPMGTRFPYLYTHGYFLVPNPYPNGVFTRRVRGYRVPIAIPARNCLNMQSIHINNHLIGPLQTSSVTVAAHLILLSSSCSCHVITSFFTALFFPSTLPLIGRFYYLPHITSDFYNLPHIT